MSPSCPPSPIRSPNRRLKGPSRPSSRGPARRPASLPTCYFRIGSRIRTLGLHTPIRWGGSSLRAKTRGWNSAKSRWATVAVRIAGDEVPSMLSTTKWILLAFAQAIQLTRLDSYGGVMDALKRAVCLQPAAKGRSVQVEIDGELTWQSQRLMEARFGCAQMGSRARSGSVNGTRGVDSQIAVPVVHKSAFLDLLSFQSVASRNLGSALPIREIGGGRERPPLFPSRCGRGGVAPFTFAPHPLGGRSRRNYPLREGEK